VETEFTDDKGCEVNPVYLGCLACPLSATIAYTDNLEAPLAPVPFRQQLANELPVLGVLGALFRALLHTNFTYGRFIVARKTPITASTTRDGKGRFSVELTQPLITFVNYIHRFLRGLQCPAQPHGVCPRCTS